MAVGRIDLSALPTPIFGPAMGTQGLGLVFYFVLPEFRSVAFVLSGLALALLCTAVLAHIAKHVLYPNHARQDVRNPALVAFYGQPAVTVLLAAEVFAHEATVLSEVLTAVGAVIAVGAAAAWTFARVSSAKLAARPAPPQLIPGIAFLMIPLTASAHVDASWCWVAVAIGLTLLGMVYLSPPQSLQDLPTPLAPTAATHLAAPAVACLDLLILVPGSAVAVAPLGIDAVVFAWLGLQLPRLLRAPFGLAWWAYTMPFSAVVLALSAVISATSAWWPVLHVALAINVLIVAAVAALSVMALIRGRLIPLSQPAQPVTALVPHSARAS